MFITEFVIWISSYYISSTWVMMISHWILLVLQVHCWKWFSCNCCTHRQPMPKVKTKICINEIWLSDGQCANLWSWFMAYLVWQRLNCGRKGYIEKQQWCVFAQTCQSEKTAITDSNTCYSSWPVCYWFLEIYCILVQHGMPYVTS